MHFLEAAINKWNLLFSRSCLAFVYESVSGNPGAGCCFQAVALLRRPVSGGFAERERIEKCIR